MNFPQRIPKAKKPHKRYRSPSHLKFVREHGCCVCGAMVRVEAAHVRTGTDGGMGMKSGDYWANHRKWFPEGFAKTAGIARALGVRLARIGDERVFIDDIPADYPTTEAIAPSCDLLCAIHQEELAA